jgi:RNA polymerase nonessential primary-like sigma factor
MPAKRETPDDVVEEIDDIVASEDLDEDVDAEDDDVDDEVVEAKDANDKSAADHRYTAGEIPDSQLDATRLYLNEIGFSKLLTAEEEVYYARLAQKGDEAPGGA